MSHATETVTELESDESYPIFMHNVGGKEPDGKPTRLGRWTFGTRIVREVVLDAVDGRVLNACAGKTKLEKRGCEFVRNDIDDGKDADHHYDVRELDQHLAPESFDSAILDPPFDEGRAEQLYAGMHASDYITAREVVGGLLRPGGVLVELGWNSWSMAEKDGWERVEHHLYRQPFKGDVHLTVDQKINQQTLTETLETNQ